MKTIYLYFFESGLFLFYHPIFGYFGQIRKNSHSKIINKNIFKISIKLISDWNRRKHIFLPIENRNKSIYLSFTSLSYIFASSRLFKHSSFNFFSFISISIPHSPSPKNFFKKNLLARLNLLLIKYVFPSSPFIFSRKEISILWKVLSIESKTFFSLLIWFSYRKYFILSLLKLIMNNPYLYKLL